MKIKFSNLPPPVYLRCYEQFGVDFNRGIVFAYDNTIHSLTRPSPDVIEHESVHFKQQEKMGLDEWWDKYLESAEFRLEQEIEAYQAQYKFFKKWTRRQSDVPKFLNQIALALSGSMYGNLLTLGEAKAVIKGHEPRK